MKRHCKIATLVLLSVYALFLSACAGPQLAQPDQLVAPQPIHANTGQFMSPYTSDDVLTEWVDNALKAKAAGNIGGALGAYAGAKALEQVPFVGGIIGAKVGDKIAKEIAIKSAGGMEFVKESSDLSFDNPDNMAVYLYVKHSQHEHYQDALNATFSIYPEVKKRYYLSLMNASRGVTQQ